LLETEHKIYASQVPVDHGVTFPLRQQGITFKERDRAAHLTAPLKKKLKNFFLQKMTPLIHLIHLKIS
jgi:hypothetical protein